MASVDQRCLMHRRLHPSFSQWTHGGLSCANNSCDPRNLCFDLREYYHSLQLKELSLVGVAAHVIRMSAIRMDCMLSERNARINCNAWWHDNDLPRWNPTMDHEEFTQLGHDAGLLTSRIQVPVCHRFTPVSFFGLTLWYDSYGRPRNIPYSTRNYGPTSISADLNAYHTTILGLKGPIIQPSTVTNFEIKKKIFLFHNVFYTLVERPSRTDLPSSCS